MWLAVIDWTQVILAGIAASVTIANGLGIALIYSHIKTPSKRTIGKQVEDVNHTARANNYHLQVLGNGLGVGTPREAAREVDQVDGLDGVKLEDPEADVG